MFDLNPGKGSIVIRYGIASSSYIHLRACCCACVFLCSNHSFRKHKGICIMSLLSISLFMFCSCQIIYFETNFCLMFDTCVLWSRSINGKTGRIMLRIWNLIHREVSPMSENMILSGTASSVLERIQNCKDGW